MNEIVRREMLAGDLPAELVPGLDPGQRVVVSVSWPEETMAAMRARLGLPPYDPSGPTIDELLQDRRVHFRSVEDVVAHVRTIRDGGDSAADT